MYKVLYANANYPDRFNLWAPWNRLANTALARSGAIEPEIIAPRPYTLPFRFFPQHQLWKLPVTEASSEGLVHYPRFPYLVPKKYFYGVSFDLYRHFVGRYVQGHIGKKDVVHAHHVPLDGYGMIGTCQRWNVPLVADAHGDALFTGLVHDPFVGKKVTETLRFSSRVICISRNIYRMAQQFGVDEEKLAYVPLGIDLDLYRPGDRGAAKQAAGLDGKIVVLFVGQLVEGKGVRYLLKAISSIDRGLLSRMTLVIVGDGPDHSVLQRMSRELGLGGHVRFEGRMPPTEVLKWYRAADIFVLPSLSEGRPTVINEAMACGCAIVASDISGIPEQVTDGYNGYLVPPGDPAALAEKIARLAESEAEIARMGRNSRQKLQDEGVTWEKYAARVTEIYGQAVNNNGG
jgi:teichuronic acid biosynthesis glycosyltransferase TuaC